MTSLVRVRRKDGEPLGVLQTQDGKTIRPDSEGCWQLAPSEASPLLLNGQFMVDHSPYGGPPCR